MATSTDSVASLTSGRRRYCVKRTGDGFICLVIPIRDGQPDYMRAHRSSHDERELARRWFGDHGLRRGRARRLLETLP